MGSLARPLCCPAGGGHDIPVCPARANDAMSCPLVDPVLCRPKPLTMMSETLAGVSPPAPGVVVAWKCWAFAAAGLADLRRPPPAGFCWLIAER